MQHLLLGYLFLVALAVASPVAKRQTQVTPAQLDKFRLFAQWAAGASCNSERLPGERVTCARDLCPIPQSHNATIVAAFNGPSFDARGFVAVDPVDRLIVAAFRGSESVRNWIANLLFIQVPCDDLAPGCLVHAGFSASWGEVSDVVLPAVDAAKAAHPDYGVVMTGYSLGGAVATLATARLRLRRAAAPAAVDLYTYGSPRVGNLELAKLVTVTTADRGAAYRITHASDPVPRLPPIAFNYRHLSPEYWVLAQGNDTAVVTPDEVRICPGYANTSCNGGTHGLDAEGHLWYFGSMGSCLNNGTTLPWKREATASMGADETETGTEISDAELEARLNEWVDMDRQFAETLEDE